MTPNQPTAPNLAIPSMVEIERKCREVGEPQCYTKHHEVDLGYGESGFRL